MKTAAAKIRLTALVAVLGVGFGLVSSASAAPADEASPITSTVPGPASSAVAAPSVAPPTAASLEKKDSLKDAKDDKSDIPAPSPKVPDSVKGVIKRLNTATQDVTLEDLNSAREAVVKLDVLIDIEKRLNDLASLRKEREEKTAATSAVAAALPASALGLPRGGGAVAAMPSLSPVSMPGGIGGFPGVASQGASVSSLPPVVPSSGLSLMEVSRILGAHGNYSALIKDADGKTKRVRAGDKLSDGTEVVSISKNGVTFSSRDKKTKTVQVHDVVQVFGER